MKIPRDAIIAREKLTDYLLVSRIQNDKSRFLAQAGFTKANPAALEKAIRLLAESGEAVEDSANEYGVFYRLAGSLQGPNGKSLAVITIWIRWNLDQQFRFVTLKPQKERKRGA